MRRGRDVIGVLYYLCYHKDMLNSTSVWLFRYLVVTVTGKC
jgi:hypothetical protein